MGLPNLNTPDNYRLLRTTVPEGYSPIRPAHIFNVRDLLDGTVSKLFRVTTRYGYEAYPDYVAADDLQAALEILADEVYNTNKRKNSDGIVPPQYRGRRPWFAGAQVEPADVDPKLDEEGYYFCWNGDYFTLDDVDAAEVPFVLHIEVQVATQFI